MADKTQQPKQQQSQKNGKKLSENEMETIEELRKIKFTLKIINKDVKAILDLLNEQKQTAYDSLYSNTALNSQEEVHRLLQKFRKIQNSSEGS